MVGVSTDHAFRKETLPWPNPKLPTRSRPTRGFTPHTSHWGVFSARMHEGQLEVRPHPEDPDPNEIIQNFPEALGHRARGRAADGAQGLALDNGPGPDARRGRDEFVQSPGTRLWTCSASELARVRDSVGPGAIFGGSYGWASAGRFPPRAEPAPSVPEYRVRRLCEVGQQLFLRLIAGTDPAHHRRL